MLMAAVIFLQFPIRSSHTIPLCNIFIKSNHTATVWHVYYYDTFFAIATKLLVLITSAPILLLHAAIMPATSDEWCTLVIYKERKESVLCICLSASK